MKTNVADSTAAHPSLGRRDFLRAGSLSLLGVGLPQLLNFQQQLSAAQANATAQSCILVWIEGGPGQMDTWDPKSNSAFQSISTKVPGIHISELFPRIANQMDRWAIIRSIGGKPSARYVRDDDRASSRLGDAIPPASHPLSPTR